MEGLRGGEEKAPPGGWSRGNPSSISLSCWNSGHLCTRAQHVSRAAGLRTQMACLVIWDPAALTPRLRPGPKVFFFILCFFL